MSTAQLQRALLWAFLATLIAVIGVTTVAWIRRPKTVSPRAAAVRRVTAPILANEKDGSVYDLNLKLQQLQVQLSESESIIVSQQKRLEEAQRQRDTLVSRVDALADELRQLRTRFEQSQQPPAPPPATGPGSSESPSAPPPGGTVPTPTPPSPAAPP